VLSQSLSHGVRNLVNPIGVDIRHDRDIEVAVRSVFLTRDAAEKPDGNDSLVRGCSCHRADHLLVSKALRGKQVFQANDKGVLMDGTVETRPARTEHFNDPSALKVGQNAAHAVRSHARICRQTRDRQGAAMGQKGAQHAHAAAAARQDVVERSSGEGGWTHWTGHGANIAF